MVKITEVIILPEDKIICCLLSKSRSHDNLENFLRFVGGHIQGHKHDNSVALATSALVFE